MKKGGVTYALWKLDCYLAYRYVEVNLLNGRGRTKLSSHRLRVTSSFSPVFACIAPFPLSPFYILPNIKSI